MKAASFRYAAPERLDEVYELLGDVEESRVIAGGQSLVPMMNMRLAQPEALVDLRRVAPLRQVQVLDDGVELGAMVTQARLGDVREAHPLLREAVPLIGHAQIRNRGTVGGSLAHADPGAELPAVAVALGATVRVGGAAGERPIPAADFFVSFFTTALDPAEIVTSVEVPSPVAGEGWAIAEVARRRGDFALAGVVARLVVGEEQVIRDAAVVPFAVGSRPVASGGAAGALVGNATSADVLATAARIAAAEVDPPSDIHASARYRRQAVAVLAERALASALEKAGAGREARREERGT